MKRVEGAPVFAVRIWIPGGSRVEWIAGQAMISGRLLAEGTRRRDWRRISEEAEALGCSVTATAGYSVQALALDGLATDWELILAWAVELMREASFPAARCDWLCRQGLAELESLADLPDVVTEWSFLEQLYPNHPLGRPLQGTPAGLAALSAEACRSFHRKCMSRGSLIAAVGEIDPETVSRRLEELLGGPDADIAEEDLPGDRPPEPRDPHELLRRVALPPGEQAHLFVGALTARRSDPDFDALRVLGVALGSGGGLVGRLPGRIREQEGMAYACDVASVAGAGFDRGRLAVVIGTATDRVDEALEAVREELGRVHAEGVSEEEVAEARSFLIGRESFRRETARQWALLGLESLLWGLPIEDESWCRECVAGVSVEAVADAARQYLDPARLVVTIGSPV